MDKSVRLNGLSRSKLDRVSSVPDPDCIQSAEHRDKPNQTKPAFKRLVIEKCASQVNSTENQVSKQGIQNQPTNTDATNKLRMIKVC